MRIVIELKRDAIPQRGAEPALQAHRDAVHLRRHHARARPTGAPKVMNLKELLEHYIDHRHEIIVRRTQFDLDAAQAREHILEGLKIAVDNIDEVIKIIRGSEDTPEADARLRKRFGLSEKQSDAILNMRLAKLTGLEIEKLEAELKEVRATIKELKSHPGVEAQADGHPQGARWPRWSEPFGDERRTEIVADQGEFTVEDLIAEEDMVITISHTGYIKRIPVTHLQAAAPRRPGSERGRPQGRRLGRAPVHREHPRLPALLHQHRAALLAQGARDPAGGPRGAGQAGGQLHRHQARRSRSRPWCRCGSSPTTSVSSSPPGRAR